MTLCYTNLYFYLRICFLMVMILSVVSSFFEFHVVCYSHIDNLSYFLSWFPSVPWWDLPPVFFSFSKCLLLCSSFDFAFSLYSHMVSIYRLRILLGLLNSLSNSHHLLCLVVVLYAKPCYATLFFTAFSIYLFWTRCLSSAFG